MFFTCGGFVHFSRQIFSRFLSVKITLTLTHLPLRVLLKLVEQFSSHCLATTSDSHGIPWKSMEIYGNPWNSTEIDGNPWNSTELPWSIHRVSMEFHGMPWSSMEYPWSSMERHGVPWSSMECYGVPRSSMK